LDHDDQADDEEAQSSNFEPILLQRAVLGINRQNLEQEMENTKAQLEAELKETRQARIELERRMHQRRWINYGTAPRRGAVYEVWWITEPISALDYTDEATFLSEESNEDQMKEFDNKSLEEQQAEVEDLKKEEDELERLINDEDVYEESGSDREGVDEARRPATPFPRRLYPNYFQIVDHEDDESEFGVYDEDEHEEDEEDDEDESDWEEHYSSDYEEWVEGPPIISADQSPPTYEAPPAYDDVVTVKSPAFDPNYAAVSDRHENFARGSKIKCIRTIWGAVRRHLTHGRKEETNIWNHPIHLREVDT
jgi:hypothetical protein